MPTLRHNILLLITLNIPVSFKAINSFSNTSSFCFSSEVSMNNSELKYYRINLIISADIMNKPKTIDSIPKVLFPLLIPLELTCCDSLI